MKSQEQDYFNKNLYRSNRQDNFFAPNIYKGPQNLQKSVDFSQLSNNYSSQNIERTNTSNDD